MTDFVFWASSCFVQNREIGHFLARNLSFTLNLFLIFFSEIVNDDSGSQVFKENVVNKAFFGWKITFLKFSLILPVRFFRTFIR